jgi:hypothetical protein
MVQGQGYLLNNKNSFMKQIILGVSVFTLLIVITSSCKKSSLDPGTTKAAKVSNEWWVTTYVDGAYFEGPGKISTYNTADNDDSMWVDDLDPYQPTPLYAIWGFKSKVHYDAVALTFATPATGSANYYFVDTPTATITAPSVIILGGKVLHNAAKSPTGIATDSIYFNAVFADDPTDTFNIQGYARTNFSGDDAY